MDDMETMVRTRLHAIDIDGSTTHAAAALDQARLTVARRRRRQGTGLSVMCVFAVVLGTVGLVELVNPGAGVTAQVDAAAPTTTALLAVKDWPTRGSLAADDSVITKAKATTASQAPPTNGPVIWDKVIYAGNPVDEPTTVVLAGQGTGGSSIAIVTGAFVGPEAQREDTLYLRAMFPIDLNSTPAAIGSVTSLLDKVDSIGSGTQGTSASIAVVAPDVTQAYWTSSLIDERLSDAPGSDSPISDAGAVINANFAGTGVWNSAIITDRDTRGFVISGGLTGPYLRTGTVTAVTGPSAVRVDAHSNQNPAVGDIVASWRGVIGSVETVSGSTVTVNTDLSRLDSLGFTVRSRTTNYRGELTTNGSGKLVFTPAGAPTNGVNRLVVDVPGALAELSVGTIPAKEQEGSAPWIVEPSVVSTDELGDSVYFIAAN